MTQAPHSTQNLLLNTLGEEVRNRLLAKMERIDLHRERVLAEIGQPIDTVYFPEGGVVSVIAHGDQVRTELGLIGLEGMVGVSALLGADRSPFKSFVQVNGATALQIEAGALRAAFEDSPKLRRMVLAYAHAFMVQLSFAIVSCAEPMMEARLARWLLMCHDRSPGDQIALTHEFMATMISAQRSGVTISLHSLEGAGMIRSTRGLVPILDRAKLEELAGTSYGQPEAEYRQLIAPFGKYAMV